MWLAILEAYSKTLDGIFRLSDWLKGRPYARLEDRRIILEDESRAAQIKGDINEMRRVRAKIEEIDRDIRTMRPPKPE